MIYETPGNYGDISSITAEANILNVVINKTDAQEIEKRSGHAIAIENASDTETVEYIKKWAAWYYNDGILIFWNDHAPTTEGRFFWISDLMHEKGIDLPVLSWRINDKYTTITEMAAAAADAFTTEYNAAMAGAAKEYELKNREPDGLDSFLEQIQTEAYKPSTTGISFLDDILSGGMIKQTLCLLMAAPGTGKTTLCQQMAEALAAAGQPAVFLNLEMSREQMLAKAISGRLAAAGKYIDMTRILQGYSWTAREKELITAEIEKYRESVYKCLKYNPAGIGSDLERITEYLTATGEKAKAAGTPAPVVVLDYLHLISTTKNIDAQELIKQAVKALKDYAIKYNTFVIAIVAVNRESMKKGQLSINSGRDSSNIEYTADYILTLNYYDFDQGKKDPQKDSDLAELQGEKWRRMILRLPKSRFGQPGKTAKVYFNAAANYFLPESGFIPESATPFDN